ncbi:MAG: Flagellar basal-body rod protein FlgF [Brockia lithotrophica]|uniref:Flagellar basal-body rod protein FlgF n=1 Tax=Brockia lithotrophica TaxID=933949 RepID=A0A2T5GAV1_9BACL|nr:flagellar hook basal-body protein [Brockia lithotrophica]PTQ53311.1 MAG: Flagellar basal-body rod protein FlgF [Brockia lithotrophica]
MERSFSLSVQGLVAGLRQLDVLAHRVANLDTPGALPREAVLEENPGLRFTLLPPESDPRGVYLGTGIRLAATPLGDDRGISVETGSATDLFAEDGGWFALRALDGGEVVYARSLSLTRVPGPDGDRLMVGRYALLADGGGPLVLPSGAAFRVDAEGRVFVREGTGERFLARLSAGRLANPEALRPMGDGLYFAPAGIAEFSLPTIVRQGVRRVPGDAEVLARTLPAARYLSLTARALSAADTFAGMAAELIRR